MPTHVKTIYQRILKSNAYIDVDRDISFDLCATVAIFMGADEWSRATSFTWLFLVAVGLGAGWKFNL